MENTPCAGIPVRSPISSTNIESMQGPDSQELVQLDRLQGLIELGPGKNQAALAEAQALLGALDTGIGYRHEKIDFARDAFATWFSEKKWQNWGAEPAVYRGILQNHVASVRFAVENLQKSGG